MVRLKRFVYESLIHHIYLYLIAWATAASLEWYVFLLGTEIVYSFHNLFIGGSVRTQAHIHSIFEKNISTLSVFLTFLRSQMIAVVYSESFFLSSFTHLQVINNIFIIISVENRYTLK